MTDRRLRRLSRKTLLELLMEQTRRTEELQEKLNNARAELEERRITVAQAGTLAEAALRLNGVFAAADRAARQYLDNLKPETADSGEADGTES